MAERNSTRNRHMERKSAEIVGIIAVVTYNHMGDSTLECFLTRNAENEGRAGSAGGLDWYRHRFSSFTHSTPFCFRSHLAGCDGAADTKNHAGRMA